MWSQRVEQDNSLGHGWPKLCGLPGGGAPAGIYAGCWWLCRPGAASGAVGASARGVEPATGELRRPLGVRMAVGELGRTPSGAASVGQPLGASGSRSRGQWCD
jgi:hypothetical protein